MYSPVVEGMETFDSIYKIVYIILKDIEYDLHGKILLNLQVVIVA